MLGRWGVENYKCLILSTVGMQNRLNGEDSLLFTTLHRHYCPKVHQVKN